MAGIMDSLPKVLQKIEEGEKRAARLYTAVENLRPVFERWEELQEQQTPLLKELVEEMKLLRQALEANHG